MHATINGITPQCPPRVMHFSAFILIGVQTPSLVIDSMTTVSSDTYNVTLRWMADDFSSDDVQYVLSISDSSKTDPDTSTTFSTTITLNRQFGVHYYINVTAVMCGDNSTSRTSNELHLFYMYEPGTAY